jgi:Rps23 Pro-64 3,4-dihydroxylase Tpa1-like proline 4-hydroxylase
VTDQVLMLDDFVSRRVLDSAPDHARAFQQGQPFRHVVIDQFLTSEFCHRICEQFPEFKAEHAINENEQVGGKATREKVRSLGPAYMEADDLLQSPGFLALIEQITGVGQLQYDPFYFGGGTHENRAGQDLDPHVDFNFHPVSNQHRRLNLIVYLNEDWSDEWGGSLQLHRDPYLEPEQDEIVTVTPLKNRCVIFETSEHSWHGFERIVLPEDKRHLSRKSFAVYFYTETRPRRETAEEHSTVYVERHLPGRFAPGMTLNESDIRELKQILYRRDEHLKRLYRGIQDMGGELNRLRYPGGDTTPMAPHPEEISEDISSALQMIQVLRNRVNDLESSTSWRLTAPVRAVKRLISGKS